MGRLNLIFILLFILQIGAMAQSTTATGCLLPNNIIYKDAYLFTIYYKTSSINTLPANRCSWTPASGPTCYVSASRSFDFGCFCYIYDSPQPGISGTFTASTVGCPLDDYIPYLILALGGVGFFALRKSWYSKSSSKTPSQYA